MALVSVVTATYAGDDPQHLAEAVDSVVAATHRPLELHVACDGPVPEPVAEVLAQRAADHSWIHIHDLPGPAGPAAARNAVLPLCQGEYVAILDADDTMVPERICRQVEFLTSHDLDLVASWLTVVDESGDTIDIRKFPETWQDVRAKAALFCPTANTAALFRRSLLPQFRYPENLRMGEDYRLWVELLRAGRRIGNVPVPLTRYRTGGDYFARRRGWAYATSDLTTKLHALVLVAWWRRPYIVGVAGASFVVRLLPAAWFRGAYRLFERITRA
jgi:glycosyltransferase involved in cell wall biosynthesis